MFVEGQMSSGLKPQVHLEYSEMCHLALPLLGVFDGQHLQVLA
jgi:hypothetical protein